MKIVGGIHKGKTIATPQKTVIRPTTSVLREAVFNMCQQEIEGAFFLDLFAGSGAMGLEALSRGAELAIFVDNDKECVEVIKKNLKQLQERRGQILFKPAKEALLYFKKTKKLFDIIYVDPPYGKEGHFQTVAILKLVDRYQLVRPGGMLFVEEDCKVSFEAVELIHLQQKSLRTFGRSYLFAFAPITEKKGEE